jgi:hypothetical protein
MKKRYVLIACIVPLTIWLIVPFLIKYPLWIISSTHEVCKDPLGDNCKNFVAMLGQSGDIYGLASSLFSGLALFAVAASIWADMTARKAAQKPRISCGVDSTDQITFDQPALEPCGVRLKGSISLMAVNEVALNVSLDMQFKIDDLTIPLGNQNVEMPLTPGQTSLHRFQIRLAPDELQKVVNCNNAKIPMKLILNAKCDSMENIPWNTSVTFDVNVKPENVSMVQKVLAGTAGEADWAKDEAIVLSYNVEPRSWNLKRA